MPLRDLQIELPVFAALASPGSKRCVETSGGGQYVPLDKSIAAANDYISQAHLRKYVALQPARWRVADDLAALANPATPCIYKCGFWSAGLKPLQLSSELCRIPK